MITLVFFGEKRFSMEDTFILFSKHMAMAMVLFFFLHLLSANSEIISPIGQWWANVLLFKLPDPCVFHL